MAKLFYVTDVIFECTENPITLGDNKFRREIPYDGEVLGYHEGARVAGHIQHGGSGAGTATQFQFRIVERARDLFSTEPEFRVDSEGGRGTRVEVEVPLNSIAATEAKREDMVP